LLSAPPLERQHGDVVLSPAFSQLVDEAGNQVVECPGGRVAAFAKRRRPISMLSPRLSTSPSVKARSVAPGAKKVLVET